MPPVGTADTSARERRRGIHRVPAPLTGMCPPPPRQLSREFGRVARGVAITPEAKRSFAKKAKQFVRQVGHGVPGSVAAGTGGMLSATPPPHAW